MKGIILAGGKATRLHPVTKSICKQLLPVYDKPMVYYPLSVLMLAGITDILIISTPHDLHYFEDHFGDGTSLGLSISYVPQPDPKGIAHSFIIAEQFIGNDSVCLILGDNIFYGDKLPSMLQAATQLKKGATIFAYPVHDPERYGVVQFDKNKRAISIIEKPKRPLSSWAVTGLYCYDHNVISIAKSLKPSRRGELEITDINQRYLKNKTLNVQILGRGFAWLDTGTPDSLIDASLFIKTIEDRQGLKIGCIEEIAYHRGLISKKALKKLADQHPSDYGLYLKRIVKHE